MFRQELVERARELRGHLTAAEVKLWSHLRGDKLGVRFRRQHRIGSYIADFYCPAAKLVVELDGGSHDERQEYDAKRTHWMAHEKGVRVVRFLNEDVMKHLESVLQAIAAECSIASGPSPQPSPRKKTRGEGARQVQP